MRKFSLAGEAILITLMVVTAALATVLLAVIIASVIRGRTDVDLLDLLYLMAALVTICGAGISMAKPVAGWLMRRRRSRQPRNSFR